jgi:hypothetical protein
MAAMKDTANAQEHAAETAWRAFCAREGLPLVEAPSAAPGVSAEWLTEVGAQPAWLAAHGRAADLIVMGRRAEGRSVALDVLETVLMDTGRPVLIASDKSPGPLADTVAIAWKDTPDAASAVWAALPFIRAARRVIVFTVEEEPGSADRSDRRVLRALRWSNPNTSVQALKRDGRPPGRGAAPRGRRRRQHAAGHGRLRPRPAA